MPYVPSPNPTEWERAAPEAAGLDPAALAVAARHAAEHETPWSRDLAHAVATDFGEEPPWNEALGPVWPRGGPNGLVLRHGRVVTEWGDTTRCDLTFSVAKSYLSILAGLAFDRGLIRDVHEPVRRTVDDGGFDPPRNNAITWHHLLQQTSEWEGELWGKPDLIDRNRSVGGGQAAAKKGTHRDLQPPGGFWEYNDVRVNRPEPRLAALVAPAFAGGVSRVGYGADRRFTRLAMARLSQLFCRDRRPADAVGVGGLALGRRRLDPCLRSGAHRPLDVARR